MADTRRDSSLQPVAGVLPQVLATKLYLPSPGPGFVSRSRLVDDLDRDGARKLTLICAPAGFGKTALLANWSQPRAREVGWVSLDTGENDPVRFWRYVVAALDRVRPGIASELAPFLGAPGSGSFDGLVSQVINELALQPDDVFLVLDDYHVIDAVPVHDSVSYLLEHAPIGLHVLLASRADPPLPLALLRGRGELTELRAADLRFTAEEAGKLLRDVVGSSLDDAVVARLAARTEGWAAGLQLAAVSLHDHTDVEAFVESFSGSHRYVLDYLTEEVLERQTAEVREFLLETSILERHSGPLCDAVTGRTDSQTMLESIEKANLFLEPLDDVRGWWRNHQLFADLLRVRLQRQGPNRVFELHRNAARWYEGHGLVDEAIHHATTAGDVLWAARMIERHADAQLVQGEETTLQRWIAALPRDVVTARPRLLLAQTRFVLLDEVEELLDAAERALADAPDEPYEPSVGRGTSRLANVPAMIAVGRAFVASLRGDGEASMSFAMQARAELDEDEWMLESFAIATFGVAEWLCGRLEDAERTIASTIAHWRAHGVHESIALWCQYLGQVELGQGRLDRALATYRQVLDDRDSNNEGGTLSAAASAQIGIAAVAYQRNELDEAEEYVNEGLSLCRQFVSPDALANGLAQLAWIRQARGDASGAADAMTEAAQVADPAIVDLLSPVPAQRARLQLAQGDVAAAARWADERGLSADDELTYAREPAYLVLARVLLAQQQNGRALELLDRLLAAALVQKRNGSVIDIQVARALALSAGDDEAGAVAALTQALALAQDQGHVRIVVDEGPPVAALLGSLLTAPRPDQRGSGALRLDYVARLGRAVAQQAVIGAPDAAPSGAFVPSMVTQLSERELEVLRLLTLGEPNQQIADELYLALNTVKKHVTHIFEKLGVTNRTEAAARARELGLLP